MTEVFGLEDSFWYGWKFLMWMKDFGMDESFWYGWKFLVWMKVFGMYESFWTFGWKDLVHIVDHQAFLLRITFNWFRFFILIPGITFGLLGVLYPDSWGYFLWEGLQTNWKSFNKRAFLESGPGIMWRLMGFIKSPIWVPFGGVFKFFANLFHLHYLLFQPVAIG